jgi:hypothetical protein
MKIDYISYKQGILMKLAERKQLKPIILKDGQLTEALLFSIEENDILSITGGIGDKKGHFPMQYEEIKIKSDGKVNIIKIYSKGMVMAKTETETPELKQVSKFCDALHEQILQ